MSAKVEKLASKNLAAQLVYLQIPHNLILLAETAQYSTIEWLTLLQDVRIH
jgi:hypothetical protein